MAFYKLSPFLVKKIWGGHFLTQAHPLKYPYPIGESLEVSTLEDEQSFNVVDENKIMLESLVDKKINYLVKFLDTSDNLSIQAHPNDYFAKKMENSKGKSECWLILEANSESGIYLGFKDGMTKDHFEHLLREGKQDINKLLNYFPVKKGDFFYVPAGTIHAIGKDVVLVEVQQSSGITYRVWDWNRVDDHGNPRTLHISKALDILNFNKEDNTLDKFLYKSNLFNQEKTEAYLLDHYEFKVHLHFVDENSLLKIKSDGQCALIFLEGEGDCKIGKKALPYSQFESLFKTGDNIISVRANKKTYFLKID